MATVGVVGEALVDVLPVDADDGSDLLRGHPGGSPANVAVAMARLGLDSHFLGRTSTDRWGRRLRDHLTAQGVTVDGAVGDEPTAIAFVDLDDEGRATYRFLWDGTADRQLDAPTLAAGFDGLDAVHVGSVQCLLPPGADVIAAAVAPIEERRVVSFDPNVRADLVEDVEVARARLLDLADHAHVVKASDEDLAFLLPDHDVERAAWELLDGAQTQVVVVTEGERGARLFTPRFELPVAPDPRGDVVDTVGAGDTFMAGLLAGLADHGALAVGALKAIDADTARAVARVAAAAAGVVVTRAGADPPTRADLGLT